MKKQRLPPKFAKFPTISIETLEVESEIALTKLRWERMNKEKHPDNKELDPLDTDTPAEYASKKVLKEEENRKRQEEEDDELECRQIYDPDTKTLDLRKLRTTDIKTNRSTIMPKSGKADEETLLLSRKAVWLRAARKYIEMYCDEKGEVKDTNLTQQEARGIKKLLKRMTLNYWRL